jgi:hypothetical protein
LDVSKSIVEKKILKGVKMTIAKWTSVQERSRNYAILLEDLMRRGVCRRAVKMLLGYSHIFVKLYTPFPPSQ